MLSIQQIPSPNFNSRGDIHPDMIIMHYTDMISMDAALTRLCDPDTKVSAHYMIDEDGHTIQMVDEEDRAWHAGKAYWRGTRDINARAIGIELVNPGHTNGYRSFPAPQIESLILLYQAIKGRHGAMQVLAHSDVAPARKQDPGELFPWQDLARRGIGLWPEPGTLDHEAAEEMADDRAAIRALLKEYGYDPDAPFETVVRAYHRHFYPEKFLSGHDPAHMDPEGLARLLALLRLKHENQVV